MMAGASNSRQANIYWRQMGQLKAACVCIRLYRNRMGWWVRAVEIVRAVASSGAIGAWVVWKDYPLLWGGIIAAAQVMDALKNVFPFAKQHKGASDLTVALEQIHIDAQLEWEQIRSGLLLDKAIMERCRKLRLMQLDAERKHFPEGFDPGPKLVSLAEKETRAYLLETYPEEETL